MNPHNIVNIRLNFFLLLILCFIISSVYAQTDYRYQFTLGDSVPKLYVSKWVKGNPISTLVKGKIYVVEFWATWCVPCIKAMPHLSDLARRYQKDNVTFIGVDVYEKETTSLNRIKNFVDSMGNRMDYNVAIDNNDSMVKNWLKSAGRNQQGIPRAFIVNKEGKLSWSGLAKDLDLPLLSVVNSSWDLDKELTKRNEENRIDLLASAVNDTLYKYVGDDRVNPNDLGQPDSILLKISQAEAREPKLAKSDFIIFNTFSSLLKTNPDKAYDYGESILKDQNYYKPPYLNLFLDIERYSSRLHFPSKIYELGAEFQKARISSYHNKIDLSNAYHKMADFYYYAKDKSKAKRAGRKAIRVLKKERNFSSSNMALYRSQLKLYKSI